MEVNLPQIAARMRELRESAGESPAEAARALDLTEEEYRACEEGRTDIPVGFLSRFAARYRSELSTLLTGAEPRLSLYTVIRKGQGPIVDRHHGYRYEALAAHFVHKKGEPFLVTVGPGEDGAPITPNAHPGQEFDFVLEGRLRVVIGDHEVILEAGDSVFFDSIALHGMSSLDGRPARFLAVIL